jgi:hypothetical protein
MQEPERCTLCGAVLVESWLTIDGLELCRQCAVNGLEVPAVRVDRKALRDNAR